ncbi:hypothetical protein L2E82_44619 [Cichorium intybus]|uniref:Uncharacterized protein n=1 Tax=Cichorium intybus TaxID=13427 RepID=A0ACB8ZR91_CICIN|nr:hypothetical protein L2E82_44619 [Cichorium intybus]
MLTSGRPSVTGKERTKLRDYRSKGKLTERTTLSRVASCRILSLHASRRCGGATVGLKTPIGGSSELDPCEHGGQLDRRLEDIRINSFDAVTKRLIECFVE